MNSPQPAADASAQPEQRRLPIHDMRFAAVKHDGLIHVKGGVTFHSIGKVNPRDKQDLRLLNHLELKMKHAVWHKVYGAFQEPLYELEMIALRYTDPRYEMRVEQLLKQIRELLEFPETPTGALSDAAANAQPLRAGAKLPE